MARRRSSPARCTHGQGHQTAYAMLVSDQTGIPIDRITLVDGDTDRVRTGGGTGGSRSLQLGGSAVHGATEAMVNSAKELAARLLEADVADIVVDTTAGTVGVAGVPAQALTWADLAARAADEGDRARPASSTSTRTARRSRSVPTSRWSRSTPTPARSGSSATSRSTTAARCSTRCSSRASSTAASPPASARPCTRRSSTTATAIRSRRIWPSTPCRRPPSCRRSRCTRPRRRPRSTRSARRASARPPRSARHPRCRTR